MAKKPKRSGRSTVQINTLGDDVDEPKSSKSAAETAADDEDDDKVFKDDEEDGETSKAVTAVKKLPLTRGRPRLTHSLNPQRKLTKKDEASLSKWSGNQRGKTLDGFFTRQAAEARKKFGHEGVYLGSQAENLVIGIPCPALAFEYVLCQDCFPLGLVLQIVAKHGVGKSALVAEFGRWFDLAGGGTSLMENETKFNPHWYTSIMGKEVYGRMQLHRCKSVEDWQRHLTWSIKKMKSDMEGSKEAPGPGRIFPVMFGVDSIMGKMSEENQEKILGKIGKKGKLGTTGEGFAQARSFPIEAGSITKYMRTVPQLMDRWPFALVLVNHLRMKQDDAGNPERNKTGGEQVNFQESFELELKKMGGHAKKIQCADFEGIELQISCEKNSFGPTGRKARTRMLWWYENDETGRPYQKTVWDWDWATVHLLNTLMSPDGNAFLKNRLKEIDFHIDCPATGEIENSAWSKSLGMGKDDALPWNQVGALIRENKTLMDNLRDALGITRRPMLEGDYLKQMDVIAEDLP